MTYFGGTVEIHGHRGARGLRPENTLPGFAHALELGVHAVEFDVGLTADGAVVCNHDQVLSPANLADTAPATPGDALFPYVGRALRDLTFDQVRTVDAGARTPAAFAATQRPVPGTPLPTLAEACTLFGSVRDVGLAVELKTDPGWTARAVDRFTAAVGEVLAAHGLLSRSRLLAFDWRVLGAAARHVPGAGRVALVERKTLVPGTEWLAGLPPEDPVGVALAAGATVLSPEHDLVTSALVEDAQALGLPVTTWTVNDPIDMGRLIDLGVDAIVTDHPDRLRAVLRARGFPLPAPSLHPA
ncbi:glycerophosphodiester phosphodiesterase family protein [Actinomadura rupiterrae]|uniref:glycerophosphodiester phosphodiesterase family protein n=1 Tax=Actinomadura rupiterrae TaxID=559627 RepID=UPI0020A40C76|nr:glycerophosphodiester phosphodiesterase family protein [Actinomadura rupiterrae]MCP2337789.1 glycerophosphoryl diester phosphodiesterase [Actinomadura rupiterrae]